MGLLDSVLGAALGGNGQQGNAMRLVMQLVEQSGGMGQLMEKLQQGGLADALQSWVSSSGNDSVSGEQLQAVLGGNLVQQAAAKVGMNGADAGNLLAEYLPKIIDQITPNGSADEAKGVDLSSIGGTLLKNLFK